MSLILLVETIFPQSEVGFSIQNQLGRPSKHQILNWWVSTGLFLTSSAFPNITPIPAYISRFKELSESEKESEFCIYKLARA